MELTVENVRQKFAEKLHNNSKLQKEFLGFERSRKVKLQRRFGKDVDVRELSIEEKTYHGWFFVYFLSVENVINGR